MLGKSLNNKIVRNILLRRISQDWFLANKLSSFLREVKFSEQEFFTSIPISNIKYDYLRSKNNDFFYLINDELNYILAQYFVESEIIKSNVDK